MKKILLLMMVSLSFVNLTHAQNKRYSFNGNVNNDLANGNNGVITGTTSYIADRFGNANSAILMGGSGSQVNFGQMTAINGQSEFTIAGWFQKPQYLPGAKVMFSAGGPTLRATYSYTGNTPTILVITLARKQHLTAPTNNLILAKFHPAVAVDEWFHYAYTLKNGVIKTFINGQVYGESSNVGNACTGAFDFLLGSDGGVTPSWATGIDDIYIINTALTASQVDSVKNINICGNAINITQQPADNIMTTPTQVIFEAMTSNPSATFQWQVSRDGGNTFSDLVASAIYQDVNTSSLIVDAADSQHAFQFRLNIMDGACSQFTNAAKILFPQSREWKFDGNLQSTSNTNNFVHQNGTLTYGADRFGNANKTIILDNNLENIGATGLAFLANAKEFSVSGWFRRSTNGDYIYNYYGFATPNITLNGYLAASATTGAGMTHQSLNNSNAASTAWRHYAISYKGGVSKIYLDGVLTTISKSTVFTMPASFTEIRMLISNQFGFNFQYVDGLYVTNHELSQTQIDSLRNLPNPCDAIIPITQQPTNVFLPATGTASFTCLATGATSTQWQVGSINGIGFANITNDATYSGATTNTLTINATLALQGLKYRCVFSNGTSCTTVSSDTVSLTIQPTASSVAYSFNAGSAVNDLGTGYNGTPIGATTLTADRFGNPNKAYKINGGNSGINCGDITFLHSSPQLTINCWLQKENNGQKFIYSKTGGSLFARPTMVSTLTNGTQPQLTPSGLALYNSIAEGEWMMFTTLFDRGTNKLFINGIEVASEKTNSDITLPPSTLQPYFIIGGNETQNFPPPSLVNSVDDFFITNRALTQPQIDSMLHANPCGIAFTEQPTDKNIQVDNVVYFMTNASGSGITYQWQVSTDNGFTYTDISNDATYSGATTKTLMVNATNALNKYKYKAKVNSGTCLASSFSATLTFTKAVAYSFNDMTTNNNLGTNNPGVPLSTGSTYTADRFGNANKAYNIGGGLNGLNIGNLPFLASANTFSFTGWFQKNNSFNTGNMFTATSTGSPAQYLRSYVYYDGTATANFVTGSCLNGTTALTSNTDSWLNVDDNEWFHYAYVYNKPNLSIYINGNLYAKIDIGVTPEGLSAALAGGTFIIGGYPANLDGWAKGVDDIYITSDALTMNQIDSLKNLPNSCPPATVNITPSDNLVICNGASTKLSVLNNGGVYNWYATNVSATSLGTGSNFTTPSLNDTTTYYVEASCPNCPTNSARLPITVNVKPVLSAPNDVTPIANKTICPNKSTKLVASSAGNSIVWWDAATGGNVIGSGDTLITPSIAANTSFYASANSGICEGTLRTQIDVITDANLSPAITLLQVNCPTNILGSTYRFPVKVVSDGSITIGSTIKEAQLGDTATYLIAPNTSFTITSNNDGCVSTLVSNTPAFTPNGVVVGASACQSCAIRDNKNYTMYDVATSQKLVGVNDPNNTQSLGNLDICVNVGTAFINNGAYYLGRNFHITPDTNSTATLRLFFTPAELTALQVIDPSASLASLYVVAFDGLSETPTQFSSYTNYGPFVGATDASGNHYVDVPVSGFSGFYITSIQATPLPIESIEFSAKLVEPSVVLNWKAINEVNNDFFTVEKSVDGIEYKSIHVVKSKSPQGQTNSYSYIDLSPSHGSSFYRIKQTDFDQKSSYSKVQKIERNSTSEILIYPNPCMNQLTISANNFADNIIIEVYSIEGKLISKQQTSKATYKLNVESLTKGTYILRVSSSEKTYTTKFVRQ